MSVMVVPLPVAFQLLVQSKIRTLVRMTWNVRITMVDRNPGVLPAEFLMSIQQLGSTFGCIPLTPISLYQGPPRVWHSIPDVLQEHRMIWDSGIPNYAFLLRLTLKFQVGVSIFVIILTNNWLT